MAESFKVVRFQDLVDSPSFWQTPANREAEFRKLLEEALNRMAAEGWAFTETYGNAIGGGGYFIFRRQEPTST
jgi:hypothetical protein